MSISAPYPLAIELARSEPWHLGKVSRRILEELADTVLPEAGRTEEIKEHVVRHIDGWVPHLPAFFRRTLPLGLQLLQWGTVLGLGEVRPFTLLPEAARRRYLKRWERIPLSMLRGLLFGIRGLILSAYYTMPGVHDRIGYRPNEHIAECKRRHTELMGRYGHIDNHTASMIFEEIGRGEVSR